MDSTLINAITRAQATNTPITPEPPTIVDTITPTNTTADTNETLSHTTNSAADTNVLLNETKTEQEMKLTDAINNLMGEHTIHRGYANEGPQFTTSTGCSYP